MSISDEISRLSGNISDSFGAVEDMGGTVPQNTNSDNLAAAIRSIPQPDTVTPESIAIVANGNTHGAITSGQYVYVRGHATLEEGLYTATAAIAANSTLSTSNLTAVSGGGLNDVRSRITWGEASTPSDHPHYIDISRGSYNNIIACIRANANYNICAYPYSGSAFRVIIRSADGSLPSAPVAITFALFK